MSTLNKIYISESTDKQLRTLKIRTGLTPNLIIRIGLVFSLEEEGVVDLSLYGEDQFREFNRYTLLGEWDLLFIALLKERMNSDGFDIEQELEIQLKSHIARGVSSIYKRLKSVEDLSGMLRTLDKKMKLNAKTLEKHKVEIENE